MFTGRQAELKNLSELYETGSFECVILHGQSRVGKTALINSFIKGKRSIYYAPSETSSLDNLDSLFHRVYSFNNREVKNPATFEKPVDMDDFPDLCRLLFELSFDERLVLVIDDYEYLSSAKDLSQALATQIKQLLSESQLMLILSGKDRAFLPGGEKDKSDLASILTGEIHLQPFNFFETKRYYKGFSPFDIALIYGMTGGIPGYLAMMDCELSIEDNIKGSFLSAGSQLFEEPSNRLRREVRDPVNYNAILKAIADGVDKNAEISAAVGLETSACTAFLKNLISFGIISKHSPITKAGSKKTIYTISDNMMRFWYTFVPNNLSLIMSDEVNEAWKNVEPLLDDYMQSVFQDMCRNWIELRNAEGHLPMTFGEVGRWWAVDQDSKKEVNIPIVAYANPSHALFGDCLWQDTPVDSNVLITLEHRSGQLNYANRYLILFSKSGFTDDCTKMAEEIGASLILFE